MRLGQKFFNCGLEIKKKSLTMGTAENCKIKSTTVCVKVPHLLEHNFPINKQAKKTDVIAK